MNQDDKGFSVIASLIILVTIGLISGVGFYVWNNQSTRKSTIFVQTPLVTDAPKTNLNLSSEQVTLTLIEKTTNLPLKDTDVSFGSGDGSLCTSSGGGCGHVLTWKGRTDSKGTISFSVSYLQKRNQLSQKTTFITGTVGYETVASFDASGISDYPPNDSISVIVTHN